MRPDSRQPSYTTLTDTCIPMFPKKIRHSEALVVVTDVQTVGTSRNIRRRPSVENVYTSNCTLFFYPSGVAQTTVNTAYTTTRNHTYLCLDSEQRTVRPKIIAFGTIEPDGGCSNHLLEQIALEYKRGRQPYLPAQPGNGISVYR